MGSVLGRTGISAENGLSPEYKVLAARVGYEIRNYPQFLLAEVPMEEENGPNSAFSILAKYIGVFGNPENTSDGGGSGEKIAMTAPVVTDSTKSGEKIAMTAPVVTDSKTDSARTMSFIMPSKYNKLSDLPRPTDKRVSIREVPSRNVLASTFSGRVTDDGRGKLEELIRAVRSDGLFADAVSEDKQKGGKIDWKLAQYHPPFTLPILRKNEIWIHLSLTQEEVQKAIEQGSNANKS